MSEETIDMLVRLICDKAKEFGADVAGVANVEDLKQSPSHQVYPRMPEFSGVGTRDPIDGKRGMVRWPEGSRSAIVIGVEHPSGKPELDWWQRAGSAGNTMGNIVLMRIVSELAAWLERDEGIRCFKLPYHIENGGVYVKDAAVLGGLGHIGKNNMLVTPRFGPRVRLRAMLTNAELPSVGVVGSDPCEDCDSPCRTSCPQEAFAGRIYSREPCNRQMTIDESGSASVVKYCRACELACPVGSNLHAGRRL